MFIFVRPATAVVDAPGEKEGINHVFVATKLPKSEEDEVDKLNTQARASVAVAKPTITIVF